MTTLYSLVFTTQLKSKKSNFVNDVLIKHIIASPQQEDYLPRSGEARRNADYKFLLSTLDIDDIKWH